MENLVITTLSRQDNKIFNELAKLASKHECHINYSHLATLGTDHSLTLQITGNWSNVAKIEAALPALAKRLEIEFIFKRSHQEKIERFFLPYRIEIFALDQKGIVYEITEFLASIEVYINHLTIMTTSHQQTSILKIDIQVDIPADENIADIREQFLLFCDELNLDGTLEPKK